MSDRSTRTSRRSILGLTTGASYAALAGCLDVLGGGETDPEFAVTILETNSPITDGSILETTVQVENTGNEEARDTITLDVAGVKPSTEVTLAAGESVQQTFRSRIDNHGEGGEFEAVVSSSQDTDTSQVVVRQPAAFQVEIISVTEEITDGEQFEVVVDVTNEGGVEETTVVALDAHALHRSPDSRELTLAPGESEQLALGWETDGDSDVDEIVISAGDTAVTQEVSILGRPEPTLEVQHAPTELIEGGLAEFELLVENAGDFELQETVALLQGESVLDSQEVTLAGGGSETITLSGRPTDREDDTIRVEFGTAVETLPVDITFPVAVSGSSVRETHEAAGELIEVTLNNEADQEVRVEVAAQLELEGQMIQFEPPRAISDPVVLTYQIPEGNHEQQRVVELPTGESDVTLKIPTPPWPFDVGYLPDGELLEIEYDHDVSVSGVDEEPSLPAHRQVVVREIEIAEIAITDRLIAVVENVSDEQASVDIVGVLEDAAGDIDDNISRRQSVDLESGERTQVAFEDIGARLDVPGLPFVEVDGMRENAGLNTGLLVDVEELE